MRRAVSFVALFALVFAQGGCVDQPFSAPQMLGGASVPAAQLNRGYAVYAQYCRPCHGANGDGRGQASYGLRPPPRDFTQAQFLFAHVPAPGLPPDDELATIVRRGLDGTAMRPWDLGDGELAAVLQYIKTFSPRWRNERPSPPVAVAPDPFGAPTATVTATAVARGERVYHTVARCSSCHPAYVTPEHPAQLKASDVCLQWRNGECVLPYQMLPPDFRRDPLRSVHAETELIDLYRIIASGIPGAAMPTWKGALPEEDLWALAYYVRSLRPGSTGQ